MKKKMKKLIALVGVTALLGCWTGTGYSATDTTEHNVQINVREVALINAIGTDPEFTIGAPSVGGEAFAVTSSNADAKWLQYSSIVSAPNEKRKITAAIEPDANIPAGATLLVTADDPQGGTGFLGSGTGQVELAESPADIVTGIRSGYTGTGGSEGVQLTYELAIDLADPAALYANSYTVEVKYTLTAEE